MWMKIRNTFIIFVVSGLWHGANWTFIIWGFLNALYFLPLLLTKRNRNFIDIVAKDSRFPTFKELLSMLLTFGLTVLAWIFFRAESVGHALNYLKGILSSSLLQLPSIRPSDLIFLIILFLLIEWIGRRNRFAIEFLLTSKSKVLRWSFYMVIIILTFIFSSETEQEFIYFQF